MVKVSEIMKTCVITVGPMESVAYAARVMTNNRIGSLVVMEREKPVDVVTESDVTTVVAKGLDPGKISISDLRKKRLKKKSLVTVSPKDSILNLAKLMVKTGVKRVPVVEDGELKGIVADKEILLLSPELLKIMSEKLRQKVERAADTRSVISGICEDCGGYSDELKWAAGNWMCPDCMSDE